MNTEIILILMTISSFNLILSLLTFIRVILLQSSQAGTHHTLSPEEEEVDEILQKGMYAIEQDLKELEDFRKMAHSGFIPT